jgi:hypothetical protein
VSIGLKENKKKAKKTPGGKRLFGSGETHFLNKVGAAVRVH